MMKILADVCLNNVAVLLERGSQCRASYFFCVQLHESSLECALLLDAPFFANKSLIEPTQTNQKQNTIIRSVN